MKDSIKAFLAKVEQDEELQKKFAAMRSPEEAYKLAASIQGGFTQEEFVSEMTKLYDGAMEDLSDDDMAKMAGGKLVEIPYTLTIPGGGFSGGFTGPKPWFKPSV